MALLSSDSRMLVTTGPVAGGAIERLCGAIPERARLFAAGRRTRVAASEQEVCARGWMRNAHCVVKVAATPVLLNGFPAMSVMYQFGLDRTMSSMVLAASGAVGIRVTVASSEEIVNPRFGLGCRSHRRRTHVSCQRCVTSKGKCLAAVPV